MQLCVYSEFVMQINYNYYYYYYYYNIAQCLISSPAKFDYEIRRESP